MNRVGTVCRGAVGVALLAGATMVPAMADEPAHLFGDWDGVRPELDSLGIHLTLDYTTETAANLDGGLRTGVDYAHQVGIQVVFDGPAVANIPGFSLHVAVVNRAGRNLSNDYIGDHVLQAQEIYGAGFDEALHGIWLYGEESLYGGQVDIVGGRIFPGMDFAASSFYCNFMTLTICGHPRGLTGEQGFIDWPQNTWGGRVRVKPTDDTYIMGGVYASQPYPGGGQTGFDMSTANITGAYYAGELEWGPTLGDAALPGHYKVGIGYDTTNFPDEYSDVNGGAYVLTGLPPRMRSNRTQYWFTFDQMLTHIGADPNAGLTLLGAYVHDDPNDSLFEHFVWVGGIATGFWADRPHDQIDVAFTYYKVSPSLSQTEALEQQDDLVPSYAYGVQSHGMVFEANYQIPVWDGVMIQPEFEYFIRPGAAASVPNAFVLGLKTHVLF